MIYSTLKLTNLKYYFTILFYLFALQSLYAQQVFRFEYESAQMGTKFRIILYANEQSIADSAAAKAFLRVSDLNQIMSDYLPESEVSQLSDISGTRQSIKVSKDLKQVLKLSKKWAIKTGGQFDITIGPLSKIWRKAFRQQLFPDSIQIQTALSKVGYKSIKRHFLSRKYYLKKKGMRIDLGGIAKGYAVDAAMQVLKDFGIKSALVEGGGDILVSAPPPNQTGWNIQYGASNRYLTLSNKAIASSGDLFQFLEWKGQRYSHIINPQTGYGIQNQQSVSVIANSCVQADILASVSLLLPKKKLKKWLKNKRWQFIFNNNANLAN